MKTLRAFVAAIALTNLVVPAALAETKLNPADAHALVVLSPDGLGVTYAFWNTYAVRSDRAIAPHSGMYYFEGTRHVPAANFGFGVATAAAALDDYGGATNQSAGIHASGALYYGGANVGGFYSSINDTYGIVLDYRGTHPIVHAIARAESGGPGVVFATVTMSDVAAPVYIFVYGTVSGDGFQQTINPGNDLAAQPFTYDARAALGAQYYRGGDALVLGWNEPPSVSITPVLTTIVQGTAATLTASASSGTGADLAHVLTWQGDDGASGSGATFVYAPTALGRHTVTAFVTGPEGTTSAANATVHVVKTGHIDSDRDGLSFDEETLAGTSPSFADSDGDDALDGDELAHGTSPLSPDSDFDGMHDGFEARYTLDALADDAHLDLDLDGFTNADEYAAHTDPTSASSYPGRGTVLLNTLDRHASVVLSGDALGAQFTAPGVHAVRSDVSIDPGSGWSYFEGQREVAIASFGFGFATASAPLDQAGGASMQSFGLNADGTLVYGGSTVATFGAPEQSEWYGLAVDYRGANPVVHAIVGSAQHPVVLPPVTLFGIFDPIHALVYGDVAGAGVQQTINAGADPANRPFHFPAHYVLFGAGVTDAEFLGAGFGPEHAYAGRETVESVARVHLVKDAHTNAAVILAPDDLGASYVTNHKSAIRANQPMIGEFRYFETRRHLAPINIGQGLITEYAHIDPYCCVSSAPENAPPSMSINSLSGIWRNLVFQANYDNANDTYGFAVDYRGARPIVRVIIGDELVHTLTLSDVFTPLVPMLYGNPTPPQLANSIQFGATPFRYDAAAILDAAGVDTTEFVPGWGAANHPANQPTTLASLSAPSPLTTLLGDTVDVHAAATDIDGADLSSDIVWRADDVIVGFGATLPFDGPLGTHTLHAHVADSDGTAHVATVVVHVTDGDADGDGLFDAQELALGTDPANANTDGDAFDDGDEVAHGFDPLVADSALDADGDGFTNYQEFLAGSDPHATDDYPGEPNETFLDELAKHPTITIAPGGLGVTFSGYGEASVRSDRAVHPGAGFYYFEGTRHVAQSNYGFGIARSTAPLDGHPGDDTASVNVNALGFVWHAGGWAGNLGGEQDTYGLALDYRGDTPIVYVIVSNVVGGPGDLVRTIAMPSVHEPLHIQVSGYALTAGVQQTINAGNDLAAQPFAYDARRILLDREVPGADELVLGWNPPVPRPIVEIANGATVFSFGVSPTLHATALDLHGHDVTGAIEWTDSATGLSGNGASFTIDGSVPGIRTVTARATDVTGVVGLDQVNIEVLDLDTDGDGLFNGDELVHGTDPDLADTDGDGIDDGYEVDHDFDPLASDAELDADGDGFTNYQEFLAGTDPHAAGSYPGKPNETFLDNLAQHPSITLSPDRLGVTFSGYGEASVRSDRAVIPGSGFFYFEGERHIERANYGFGVARGNAPLSGHPGDDTASMNVNALGFVWHDGGWSGNLGGEQDTYGLALDYRGTSPIAYVIVSHVIDGPGELVRTLPLPAVHQPLYIQVSGYALTGGVQQSINTGNDLAARPFAYDVRRILADNAVPGAAQVVLGWNPPVPRPTVEIADGPTVVSYGTLIVVHATALDLRGNDVTASIHWTDSRTGAMAVGAVFALDGGVPGLRTITASVVDATGVTGLDQVNVEVLDLDTDGDGLYNGDELAHGTDPNVADSDGDGMSDGYEVDHASDPLVADSALDFDGDGFTNLHEHHAGSDPNDASSYPGQPLLTHLSAVDRHASVSLSSDRLGALFSGWRNCGVRSDRAVHPGSGFYYFEGRREVAPGNYGFGLATASVPLDDHPGRDAQSMDVNALGFVWFDGAWAGNLGGTQNVYGFALDYRASTPIVYVLASASLTGAAHIVKTLPMPAVTEPLYIVVHGFAQSGDVQQTINTGNELALHPFRYDARAVLTNAGVPGASELVPGWSPLVPKPEITFDAAPASVLAGTLVSLGATGVDLQGHVATAHIRWSVAPEGFTGTGASFTFTPTAYGIHTITAALADPLTGVVGTRALLVQVEDVDSDGDGLANHEETLFGTNPLDDDSDGDGMPDGYEVAHALNALANDAELDPDGDGFTNAQEFAASTDPWLATSYPGMPVYTYLDPDAKAESVTISGDRLGVTFSGWNNEAVRSDRAILPGSGFFYFEGRREVGVANYGFGVGTASTPLDNHPGRDATSLDVNALGFIWHADAWSGNLGGVQDTYGIAVDYRTPTPTVYVIVSQTLGGPGVLAKTQTMPAVGGPLYFFVHGYAQTSGVQQTVNTGNDLATRPFRYDPVAALGAVGVAGADDLVLGWR
ncbi:MAG: hypothetical protein ACKVWV_14260 [Planctomycetota bacterium]